MFLFKTWMKTLDWTRQCFSTKHIVCFPTEHYKNSLIWKVLINEISIFLWKTLYETLSHSSQCFISCFDQKHRPMPAVNCVLSQNYTFILVLWLQLWSSVNHYFVSALTKLWRSHISAPLHHILDTFHYLLQPHSCRRLSCRMG